MNNYKYDVILYDLDGTLIDSVPVILKCFRMAYEQVLGKCERTDEEFKTFIGKPLEETFKMHEESLAGELVKTYLKINHKMLINDEVPVFEGVEEGLLKLKEMGIKQGIVTSKKKVSAMATIELKKWDEIFDVLVFKEDSTGHKPGPEPIYAACEKLGITDYSKVLYVGDAMPDALCARNAGADFALVDWSVMPREEILNCVKTRVISSISELSCINEN